MRNGEGVLNDVSNGLRYEGIWINDLEDGQFKVYNDKLFKSLIYIEGNLQK